MAGGRLIAQPVAAGEPEANSARTAVATGGAYAGVETQRVPISGFWQQLGWHLLPYLLVGQTWLALSWAVQRLFNPLLAAPDFSAVVQIPKRLLAFHALLLAARLIPERARGVVTVAAVLSAGLALKLIDLGSLGLLTLFLVAILLMFQLTIARRWKLIAVVVSIPLLRLAAGALGFAMLARPDVAIGLLICLWYACFQIPKDPRFGAGSYLGYLLPRLFFEGPVYTPDEARPQRVDVRAASRALAIAMLASAAAFYIRQFEAFAQWGSADGLRLLGFSYLEYVALSCNLVFSYNLTLGLLRLAGLPIRDNFGAFLLARTPNEHWRRWNLLYREWILTFSFYPLMRARRSLFVCVMAAFSASAALHLYVHVGDSGMTPLRVAMTLGYWWCNGVAIWLVLAVPRAFPRVVESLRLAESRAWWIVGWTATSGFYAVMFYLQYQCLSWHDLQNYAVRLMSF